MDDAMLAQMLDCDYRRTIVDIIAFMQRGPERASFYIRN